MKYKKTMILLVLAIFIFGVASVCASDVNDTVIAREDDSIIELSQADADEIMLTDENELISQTDNGLISEGNSGTFAELQANINELTNGSTITLNKNYECEDGFNSGGILIDKSITIDGQGNKIDAQGKSRIFKITAENVILKNIIFINGATGSGGAVYFGDGTSGTVSNCNFADNTARYGGAVYFSGMGNVLNCYFTGNTATYGGAVYFDELSIVENCNFVDNKATESCGAVYFNINGIVRNCNFTGNSAKSVGAVWFWDTGSVSNCNFTNNSAAGVGGAVYFRSNGNVENCNFTDNNAATGSAIYFFKTDSSDTLTVFKATFLNNRANAGALDVVKNDNNITITFTGQNNLLNAIYSRNDAEVTFNRATYWGANGITTVSATLSGSNKAAGQNITVGVVVNDKIVLNEVMITDEEGMIVLNINAGDNYYITARHDTDSYYTEAEKAISNNTQFYVNVTSRATTNKTVNITAKSNIPNDVVQGKLLFILPNTNPITASYAGNGIWWAEHTFNDYGYFHVNASYVRVNNLTVNTAIIKVIEHSFAELQSNIIAATPGSTLTLNNDYECEDGFDTEGIIIDKPLTIDGQGNKIITQGNSRIFKITSDNVTLKNIIFINGKATGSGGAVYFGDGTSGTVSNCNFINNTARDGGAVYFDDGTTGEVINCNFTDNAATSSGGALVFLGNGTVTDCNFINNTGMSGSGGAVYFSEGTVTGCNFSENTAIYGGAVYFRINGTVTNSCFTVNSATYGGAVYFDGGSYGETVNCIFADNSASRCGAIYSRDALDVVADSCIFKSSFDTTDTARILAPILTVDNFTTSYKSREKLMNFKTSRGMSIDNGIISISVYYKNNNSWVGNYTYLSSEGWTVDLLPGCYHAIFNTEYAGFESINRTITIRGYVNVNSVLTKNMTVNITAKSDIYQEELPGDLLFILSDGNEIKANYAGNGTWWAVHTFKDYGDYHVNASFDGVDNLIVKTAIIEIVISEHTFSELQALISANYGSTLKLDNDYVCEIDFGINGISITDSITIDGQGHTLDARGKGRIFNVTAENVILRNINFINGKIEGNGGAIIFYGEGTVSNCNFTNNSARDGGAVYFYDDGTVTNCYFTDNEANGYSRSAGGAVYFSGTGNVLNCYFTGNSARDGGAVYFYDDGTVTNCYFTDNEANGYSRSAGGAVYFYDDGTVTNCYFTDNKATGSYSGGGALCFEYGNSEMTNCNFTNNTASYGGAVFSSGDSSKINNVINCNFTGNTAESNNIVTLTACGDVINCNFANNTVENHWAVDIFKGTVKNCNFINNNAGLIKQSGSGQSLFVIDCNFANNTAGNGRMIDISEGTVKNCNFINNTSTGGISAWGSAIINCNFSGNFAFEHAIVNRPSLVINCSFINNHAVRGGAVYFEVYTILATITNITDCSFINNSASGDGGAIYGGQCDVKNCSFINNSASGTGGAIKFSGGSIENCNFTNNSAYVAAIAGNGDVNLINCSFTTNTGEHVVESGGVITVLNCNFTNNPAGYATRGGTDISFENSNFINSGTAIYSNSKPSLSGLYYSFNVTNCNFINNHGRIGIIVHERAICNITDCNFINNTADARPTVHGHKGIIRNSNLINNYAPWGGVFLRGGESYVINCNFTNNSASFEESGSSTLFTSGNGYVINCSFINNTANTGGAIRDAGNIENCNFAGNTARLGNAIYIINWCTISDCNFTNNPGAIHSLTGGIILSNNIFNFDDVVEGRNFTEIQKLIDQANEGDEITIDGLYTGFGIPIMITRNLTLIGQNNATLDAKKLSKILYIKASNVIIKNIQFTNGYAEDGGAVRFWGSDNVMTNCTFINNSAESGGAVYIMGSCIVSNCTFINNSAETCGALYFSTYSPGNVSNSNFIGNNATTGSAIYFGSASTLSNSILLNNRADAKAVDVVKNEDNITITFTGGNNLLNAIYSEGDVTFTNVTYWGANGITTVSDTMSGSNKAAGQNITVSVFVNNELVLNEVMITDENGMIVLDISVGDNYYIGVRHDTDSYYTEAEKAISQNMKYTVNVTSVETNSKTVNITAKSSIYHEFMLGKLIFILPDGTELDANYASNGVWWAIYTFDDCAEYEVNATYVGLDNVTVNNATITINKLQTVLTGNAVTAVYNINKNLVITLKDAKGNPLSGASVTVDLNGLKTYITDSNGQIKVSTKGLAPKAYTAKVTFNGNANYAASAKDIKVTVKKATPKMTAKKKTFKRTVKTKKYTIVLKDNTGKAMKKVKVTLKIKGKKTITAKTNSKGKATFKIKKLTKKGTYKTTVTFKGNKYYNKVVKKVKIKIK